MYEDKFVDFGRGERTGGSVTLRQFSFLSDVMVGVPPGYLP